MQIFADFMVRLYTMFNRNNHTLLKEAQDIIDKCIRESCDNHDSKSGLLLIIGIVLTVSALVVIIFKYVIIFSY